MDQNLKKKILIVKGYIQKKQYQSALDELQVLMYKYQKSYQVHLMLGLCYQKLDKQEDARKCYHEVLQLKQDQPNAIKALCDIYTKKNDNKNATIYLQKNVEVLKKIDNKKYREALVKLVQIYKKDQYLQKIHNIFLQYVQNQDNIGEDFVKIAQAYFKVSINAKSFNLQKFQLMGFKGQTPRIVQMNARQGLNVLLIDIVNYLMAVSKQYNLTQKDIANSLYQMKYYFPYAPCMLMLLLLDQYCVGNVAFSTIILEQIYKLLSSYYKKEDNGYLNLQFTEPEIFTICMVLGYEYLAFFKQFFILDACFNQFYEDLALKQQQFLNSYKVREDYSKKINNFILKKCRHLNKVSQTKNVQNQLQDMKKRIQLLQGSFLQEVIAKMAMNCFVNYQKLDDMKNMLKIRIKNLNQGDMVPHLYKYYVDYLLKISRIYKTLDQQINIYEAFQYINKYDKDPKYISQGFWLNFSRSMLLIDQKQKITITKSQIQNMQNLIVEMQIKGQLKADTLRKIAIMKVFIGQYDIQKQLKQAVLLDRSFANLQSMGFYLFHLKKHDQSLKYLKQAFILNQNHYHTNRLIFVLLFKLGFKNEAIDFVQRIKQGFRAVYWINYVLAIKYMNQKKYIEAETYLNSAIQSFSAGVNKKFKFSYEKTVEHSEFAFMYMIQQNQFSILFDQLIFPQTVIFQQLQMVSHLYFEHQTKRTQIRLFYQIAEVLKVLGRTKSSVNYLNDAYTLSLQFTQEQRNLPDQRFQFCILQKQYATILFYMRMFRQSQSTLNSAYSLCMAQMSAQTNKERINLLENIQSEIKSLYFQISVQKLANIMKYQSHETVELYVSMFKVQPPKIISLNYLKGKYQFHILQYLHNRNKIDFITNSINQYLNYFNMSLTKINTTQFENRYFELDSDKRKMVRQSLQDYYIVKYISDPEKLTDKDIMPLIQMFPRSTIFYIIYGMSTSDIKLKTASFLKCIQLDKQSPISIDLLASLYLKQKNYLAATKLFLKSLQMDILSTKCYLGLAICLFCIIGTSIATKDQQVLNIIHKALIRINSYMEYLRTVDPSQNYHLLKFFKLLVNDQRNSTFQLKTILQASRKNCKYKYKDTLIYTLLDQATIHWKDNNIWQQQSQIKIIGQFVTKFYQIKPDKVHQICLDIAKKILKNSKQQFQESLQSLSLKKYQLLAKENLKLLHQISISISLASKQKFNSEYFEQFIDLISSMQKSYSKIIQKSQQNLDLIKKIKSYLFEYIILNNQYDSHKKKVNSIFSDIKNYDHFTKYASKIPKFQSELFRQVMLNPDCDEVKKLLATHMVINGNKKVKKAKLDYKVQLINNTHENLNVQKNTFKKLVLLYRDQSSWISHISMSWTQPNQRTKQQIAKWLNLLTNLQKRIQKNKQISEQQQNNLKKIRVLKVQMFSYYYVNFDAKNQLQNKLNLAFTKEQKNKIQSLKAISLFYKQPNIQNIKRIKKSFSSFKDPLSDKSICNPLLQLLSYITNKYVYNKKFQQVLIQLIQQINQSDNKSTKAHLLLLRYLYILQRTVRTEQDLINQIMDLQKVIIACEQTGVSQNTVSILKCSKCLFSADYENLAFELDIASKKKIVTYSDQVIINFYQIMKLYKQVQFNPNKDGVIDQFAIYIDSMIMLVNDVFYQGFFYSLKAIVNSIIVPEQSFGHDRNLRISLLLEPNASKVYISNHQQ